MLDTRHDWREESDFLLWCELTLLLMLTSCPSPPLLHQAAGGPVPPKRCVSRLPGAAGASQAGRGGEQGAEEGVWHSAGTTERSGDETQGWEGQRGKPAGGHDPPEAAGCCPHEQPQWAPVQVYSTPLNTPVLLQWNRMLMFTACFCVSIRAREANLQKYLQTAARSKVAIDRYVPPWSHL